jgi:hypothetical protein
MPVEAARQTRQQCVCQCARHAHLLPRCESEIVADVDAAAFVLNCESLIESARAESTGGHSHRTVDPNHSSEWQSAGLGDGDCLSAAAGGVANAVPAVTMRASASSADVKYLRWWIWLIMSFSLSWINGGGIEYLPDVLTPTDPMCQSAQ